MNELRQEREEEERRLRIEDVDHDALGEVPAAAARRPLRVGVLRVGTSEQRPDPDHDQVQRPEHLDDGERRGGRDEDRGQPDDGERQVHERADVNPEHGGEPRRPPLVDAAGDDVDDRRPRHGQVRERRQREDGEGLRLHDHALSSQTSRSPSSVRFGSTTVIVFECGATSSDRPPVATTFASTPSSPRIAVTMPSTWPAKP